jgi:hypothetical protein
MEYKPPLRKWNITNTKGIYIRIHTRHKIKKVLAFHPFEELSHAEV